MLRSVFQERAAIEIFADGDALRPRAPAVA
jgi:hypothetical protein